MATPQAPSLVPYSTAFISDPNNLPGIAQTNPTYTQAAQTQYNSLTAGGGGTGGTSGTAGAVTNPLVQQGIVQEYGGAINAANAQYGQNEANLGTNIGALSNYTNAQENAARQQTQGQVDVYNQQAAGVQGQRELSLSELLDQIRGQHQGLQAQLGAVGAGASSASQLGDIALQKQQGIQTANINQQAGSNIANINAQIDATKKNLDPYIATIEGYKQQQLNQINEQYNQVKVQLQGAIAQASGEEKRQLGLFADGLQQAASDKLAALDQQVSSAKASIAQQAQQQFNGPQFQALPTAAAPAAIQSQQVSPFSTVANPSSGGSDAGGLAALLQKQQQNGQVA